MKDPFEGQWVLWTLRCSMPGDVAEVTPGVGAGLSRFSLIVGDEAEVMRHYESCNQVGTQTILAEVRNPAREIVHRFDRVAEALTSLDARGEPRDEWYEAEVGRAALGNQ